VACSGLGLLWVLQPHKILTSPGSMTLPPLYKCQVKVDNDKSTSPRRDVRQAVFLRLIKVCGG
jgi:hypothetical protein